MSVKTAKAPSTHNAKIREDLKKVRAEKESVRDEIAAKKAAQDQAKQAWAESGKELSDQKAPEFQAAQQATKELGELKDKLADLELAEREGLAWLGESVPDADPSGDGPGGRATGEPAAWDGHRIVEGDAYKQAKADGRWSSTSAVGSVTLGEIASRDQFHGFLAAIGSEDKVGATSADRRGFVQPQLRRLTLLDIIPTGTTDATSVEYVQIQAVPTGARETAELTPKPEMGLVTVDATAPVRTLAGYVKLARQALDDVAGLASLINSLLPYEVKRRIEAQILDGDGIGQNLKGLLRTTGIGHPEFVAGDNPADAILRAMTTVILSDGDPNFAAANPLTWQDILLLREVGGSEGAGREGMYILGAPNQMVAPTIWGLVLTANRVVPQESPLVGDSNGCSLLVKEGVNIKVSDSDGDDFTNNRVTVLAEGRVAFPVWRPASFAAATTEAE
jgi:hypothetical protein